jgi:hypothetical protein
VDPVPDPLLFFLVVPGIAVKQPKNGKLTDRQTDGVCVLFLSFELQNVYS